MSAPQTTTVTLNLFQGPFRFPAQSVQMEEWMLKQVQHDEEGRECAE